MNEVQLICFDLDDTLIQQNSWKQLNRSLDVTHEEDQYLYNIIIEMLRKTGKGITFRGSSIENEAWKVIETLQDLQIIFT